MNSSSSFDFIGNQTKQTMQTTGPSTMLQHITKQHHCKLTSQTKHGQGEGSHRDETIDRQSEHKNFVKNLTSCEGVLESTKSLTPGGKCQTGQGGNPERTKPNHGNGTDDLKHGKQTNASMRKIQLAQVKSQFTNGCWQI